MVSINSNGIHNIHTRLSTNQSQKEIHTWDANTQAEKTQNNTSVFLVMSTLKLSGHLSFGRPMKKREDVVGQVWYSATDDPTDRAKSWCFFLQAKNTPINWSLEPSLQKSCNGSGCVSLSHPCRKDKKTDFFNVAQDATLFECKHYFPPTSWISYSTVWTQQCSSF